jgi:hypothetical protein
MPDFTLPQLSACRIRVTDLDATGEPVVGANHFYVSDAMVSVGWDPNYEDGDEITEKNACGEVVISYKGDDSLKWGNITITLASPDPFLAAILSNGTVLTAAAKSGYAAPPIGVVSGDGVSIEVWTKRIFGGKLDVDNPYGWWVYPWVKNLRVGGHVHENAGLKPVYTGQTFENPNWGDGPLNDFAAVATTKMYQFMYASTLPALSAGVYGTVLADA